MSRLAKVTAAANEVLAYVVIDSVLPLDGAATRLRRVRRSGRHSHATEHLR